MPTTAQAHRTAQCHAGIPPYTNDTAARARNMANYFSCKGPEKNSWINLLLLTSLVSSLRSVHASPAQLARNTTSSALCAGEPASAEIGTSACDLLPGNASAALQLHLRNARSRPHQSKPATDVDLSAATCRQRLRPAAITAAAFLLPTADAAPSGTIDEAGQWDPQQQIMTLKDESSKASIIGAIRNFLIEQGLATETDANRLEFEWRQRAAGTELAIAPPTQQLLFSRDKRISHAHREHQISEHIAKNCAFETEILNLQGVTEGTVLLLYAQRAENPFHALLESDSGKEPGPAMRYTINGLNFACDVVTFGLKPVIGNLIASLLRRQHYLRAGDNICADRHWHLMFAQVATSLVVEGLPLNGAAKHSYQPKELIDIAPSVSNAAYFARNKNTGVKTEILLNAKMVEPTQTAQDSILLKPMGESRFVPVQPQATNVDSMGKEVHYDEDTKIWRLVNNHQESSVEVEITLGESFATIGGEQYQLHRTRDMQYEIRVTRKSGQHQYFPVYQDPISHNWFLKTSNHHASYTRQQRDLILELRIPLSSDHVYTTRNNDNPVLYGDGQIYQVTEKGQALPRYDVIEMMGELLPIRRISNHNHHVQYEAYHLASPMKQGHRIEWDGERWRLEKPTSPHLCSELKQYISPGMYAIGISSKDLSRPDHRGLRHSQDGRSFIKVNQHYVEIHNGQSIRTGRPLLEEIRIEYKDHQFHLAPDANPAIQKKALHQSTVMGEFYHHLKGDEKSLAPHQLNYKRTINATKIMFPGEHINIKQVASADLNKRRYVLSSADDEIWFLESTADGRDPVLLGHLERQKALEKYRARAAGGTVTQAFTVRQMVSAASVPEPSMRTIRDRTRLRIENGWRLVADVLGIKKPPVPSGKVLVLGPQDFFGGEGISQNSYASLEEAYERMMDVFIPLSRNFPNAIIAPGSIAISVDIPQLYRANRNSYFQEGSEGWLINTVHFSANIAPVFFAGKVVTIARKGEYLTLHAPNRIGHPPEHVTTLHTLDHLAPPWNVIDVHGYPPQRHQTPEDAERKRTGTVFAGKTLLPGELQLAKEFLAYHMAPSPIGQENKVQAIFSNEFMIGDEKFLLVIGDDFESRDGFRPSARNQALPGTDNVNEGNRYDWILHAAQERPMDELMCTMADNCLIVDAKGNSTLYSENTLRTATREKSGDPENIVYDYRVKRGYADDAAKDTAGTHPPTGSVPN